MSKRTEEIYNDYLKSQNFKEVSRKYGVTPAAIRLTVKKQLQIMELEKESLYIYLRERMDKEDYSDERVRHIVLAFHRADIYDIEDIKEISRENIAETVRGVGKKTLIKIYDEIIPKEDMSIKDALGIVLERVDYKQTSSLDLEDAVHTLKSYYDSI